MKTYVFLSALTSLLGWASALPQEDNPTPSVPEPFTELSTSYTTVTTAEETSGPAGPTNAPSCVCGATYCGKVLEEYLNYTPDQLVEGYCATPGINCADDDGADDGDDNGDDGDDASDSHDAATPEAEQIAESLFVCICDPAEPEVSRVELLCACQGSCRNEAPDYISRCETPCNLNCSPDGEEQAASDEEQEEEEPPSSGASRLRIW
ncbi:hypothetical protein SODALDRAFT_350258 [Sodiomyces alkalinus F11]|uniref:Uncharacterized protein n=1 Tax=Sodiomyces alkalinus (strain CBS 110278 / VKM F-3762 / F11) TaxID=1314773 RepID=A0A3N2PWY9_SODAK|nr:hypothetical protein SODALDRAFT_350258 [Sodiomyces alkalinus F11]ROT38992.1 hypothetical protein SODALDRAFT_350258 [Sodiomyces alkalinus F11]